ncbi:hypothetical protein LTR10_006061 [Elasticomyces elasticus]|nr:hypothetical protein LTR10_006061 [Elasticomyces elasticus]KAK4966884.1 hypothetical protein LTR42_011198 [Elasticomyces elasticus]
MKLSVLGPSSLQANPPAFHTSQQQLLREPLLALTLLAGHLMQTRSRARYRKVTPAADAALAITELLESILVRVDAKTLLLSQRVCRKWRDVIEGSLVLQQKLFLRPATLAEATNLSAEDNDKALVVMQADEDTRFMAAPEHSMTFDILPESSGLLNPLFFNGNAGCRVPAQSRENVVPSWTKCSSSTCRKILSYWRGLAKT